MGIDYNSSMIVGCRATESSIFSEIDDLHDFAEENGLCVMSEYFDAGMDSWVIGFKVDDIKASDLDGAWINDIRFKADKFKELSGVEATLIGARDIY